MQVGVRMTPWNRYTYTIFINSVSFKVSGGREIVFLSMGGLTKSNGEALS